MIENYKNQIDGLQTDKAEILNQKNKIEYEFKNLRTKLEAYEIAQSRDIETIHLLEDRLRELEFGEGTCHGLTVFLFFCENFHPS